MNAVHLSAKSAGMANGKMKKNTKIKLPVSNKDVGNKGGKPTMESGKKPKC